VAALLFLILSADSKFPNFIIVQPYESNGPRDSNKEQVEAELKRRGLKIISGDVKTSFTLRIRMDLKCSSGGCGSKFASPLILTGEL